MSTEESTKRRQFARDLLISTLALASVGIGIELVSAAKDDQYRWLVRVDLAIVAFFWFDFFRESRRRGGIRAYAAAHWWELPSLIPTFDTLVAAFPGFAFLRALRLLRLFRIVGVILRLRPAGAMVVRLARDARLGTIFGIGAIVVFLGTWLAHVVESRVNPEMASWGRSTWFAFNMFTNVAYLNFYPVTTGGRVLAGILQVCGIAFIGIFTASLAGAIMRERAKKE